MATAVYAHRSVHSRRRAIGLCMGGQTRVSREEASNTADAERELPSPCGFTCFRCSLDSKYFLGARAPDRKPCDGARDDGQRRRRAERTIFSKFGPNGTRRANSRELFYRVRFLPAMPPGSL